MRSAHFDERAGVWVAYDAGTALYALGDTEERALNHLDQTQACYASQQGLVEALEALRAVARTDTVPLPRTDVLAELEGLWEVCEGWSWDPSTGEVRTSESELVARVYGPVAWHAMFMAVNWMPEVLRLLTQTKAWSRRWKAAAKARIAWRRPWDEVLPGLLEELRALKTSARSSSLPPPTPSPRETYRDFVRGLAEDLTRLVQDR